MQSLARASGATLGYIIDNLRGAHIGYRLGGMAPIYRRKRKSSSTYNILRSMKRRRYSGSSQGRYVKKRLGSNNVVTRQYDVTTQYKKSYMPRRRKRAWKKFVKKVTAVQIKNAGLKTVLFNDRLVNSNTSGFQGVIWLGLYGNNGTPDNATALIGWKDLNRIYMNDPDIVKQGSPPNEIPISGKLAFGSAVIDITLRNLSELDAEVDIYYCVFRKNQDSIAPADDNPNYYFGNQPVLINPVNTTLNLGERGATMFDMSHSLSRLGIKILKKQKMVLEPGKSTFIQHRDPMNHVIDAADIVQVGFGLAKLTYGVCVVHKPSVTNVDNAISTIAAGVTRKYSYAALEDNSDACAKL